MYLVLGDAMDHLKVNFLWACPKLLESERMSIKHSKRKDLVDPEFCFSTP